MANHDRVGIKENIIAKIIHEDGSFEIFETHNIITTEGANHYAELINLGIGNAQVITNDFNTCFLGNASVDDILNEADNYSDLGDPLLLTQKKLSAASPALNNLDVDNTGKGPFILTWRFVWGGADFNSTGQVESYVAGAPGSAYAELIVTPSDAGDGNALLVATANASGFIERIDIIDGASTYAAGTLAITGTGAGTGFTATYTVDDDGTIDSITITNQGTSFDSPVVSLSTAGNDDAVAVATANASGFITGVFSVNGGTLYVTIPTVTIANAVTGGTGGNATATISSNLDIRSGIITLQNASGTDPIVNHWNFEVPFQKLATSTFILWVNHSFADDTP